jgi:hypothetical protein
MCRKFKLLANIENATVDEILSYFRRMLRLYYAVEILTIVNLIEYVVIYKDRIAAIFAAISMVLYAIHIVAVFNTAKDPNPRNSITTVVTSLVLLCFNIADLAFNVATGSIWGLLSIVGVLLQCTTIYILYKLHQKIVRQQNEPVASAPTMATAVPVDAPMAHAVAEPVSNPVYAKTADAV